jgi:2C-methyl-D-erythritol 2,4-cyclodiphosphate synthase
MHPGRGRAGRHRQAFSGHSTEVQDFSLIALLEYKRLIIEAGFRVHNVTTTIVAEQKMAPHIPAMVANIAAAVRYSPTGGQRRRPQRRKRLRHTGGGEECGLRRLRDPEIRE